MSARKRRIPVVFDTNVFVRNFKSRSKSSHNRRVFRLWLVERKLQLVVSEEVVAEYLEIFENVLELDEEIVLKWRTRFCDGPGVTFVELGPREVGSRDPDDNVFLSTARAGKAKFLVTSDRDLLDLPKSLQSRLTFAIVKPDQLLAEFDDGE